MLNEAGPASIKSSPKVSVLLLTYNHEKWIRQAVQSVLMQKTDFDYGVTIVEDCSSDGTRDAVIDFRQKFPERIDLSLSKENGEYRTNLATAFLASSGQYIAQLDGDDYWTSPHKLQKQVDFLDTHPECALCFHNVTVFNEDGTGSPWNLNPPDQEEITGLEDLLVDNYIASCSPMFRAGVLDRLPDWYYTAAWADWPLYILHAQHGKIGYLNEVMGARRLQNEGMWARLSNVRRVEETIRFYEHIGPNLDAKHKVIVQGRISELSAQLVRKYRKRLRSQNVRLKELEEALAEERREVRRLTWRMRELDRRAQNRVTYRLRRVLRRISHLRDKAVSSDE
jgi:glycosyltransferase involved in cell wall biosynthesis